MSLSVFSNLLLAGINSTQLDTVLNRTFWSTKNFRFYIDDLAIMMPDLLKNFSGSTDFNGACKPDNQNYKLMKGTDNSTVKVILNKKCHLNVTQYGRYDVIKIKLIEFDLNLAT